VCAEAGALATPSIALMWPSAFSTIALGSAARSHSRVLARQM
jgi:hypothetical protein